MMLTCTNCDEQMRDLREMHEQALYRIKLLQEEKSVLKARLSEQFEEIARWRHEALERRKLMIKDQRDETNNLLRLPIGTVK